MPEPQLYPVGELGSDMEYHSTLVSVYYKKVIFKGIKTTLLTFKEELVKLDGWGPTIYIHSNP